MSRLLLKKYQPLSSRVRKRTFGVLKRPATPEGGKMAVTGNHSYYAGIHRAAVFIQDAGFSLLERKDVEPQ